LAVQGDQAQHGAHGELGLVHGLRHHHATQHIDGALVHAGGDPGDLVGGEVLALHQQQQRIGGRVGVTAGGVELEAGFHQRPALAQAVGQPARISVLGHAGGHALLAFQDVARPGQPLGGQVGGQQAVGGGLGGVQLLGVGGVAQEFPQTGGLGAGTAQQVDELLLVEAHQLAHGHGGGQGADGRGGVEDAVVGTTEEFTDADARLVAGQGGQQQLAAGLAQVLGGGQGGREHHGGRVQHGAGVQVVLLHQVGAGAVHQGGEIGRAGAAADQDAGAAFG